MLLVNEIDAGNLLELKRKLTLYLYYAQSLEISYRHEH